MTASVVSTRAFAGHQAKGPRSPQNGAGTGTNGRRSSGRGGRKSAGPGTVVASAPTASAAVSSTRVTTTATTRLPFTPSAAFKGARTGPPDPDTSRPLRSSSPSNKPIVAAGHDKREEQDDNADQDSPSLTVHSHRQNHNSSKLPSFRSADLLSKSRSTSAASLVPPPQRQQRQRHPYPNNHHPHQTNDTHLRPPSPAPPKLESEPPALSDPDNIASFNTHVCANELVHTTHSDYHEQPCSATAVLPLTETPTSQRSLRIRASSHHRPLQSGTALSTNSPGRESPVSRKRPTSCPEPASANADQTSPSPGRAPSRFLVRRESVSQSSKGNSASDGPPPSLSPPRLAAVAEATRSATQPLEYCNTPTFDGAQGQRELLLPKRLSQSSSSDESQQSPSHRPPISYRPISRRSSVQLNNVPPGRVPPIRSFRSSGSRKSLTKDMNFTPRPYDLGESYAASPDEQTQQDSEARYRHGGAPLHGVEPNRQDDGGDVFLRIAREEEAVNRSRAEDSDVVRTSAPPFRRVSHRRPLSTIVATYNPTSPPRVRRLSDQQERPRPRYLEDDRATEISRSSAYQPFTRAKAASVHPGDEIHRTRSGGVNLRPSPLSARSTVGLETNHEGSAYARRRASITENNSTVGVRSSGYRPSGVGHSRNFGSSPLVKSFDYQSKTGAETAHGVEGTESTASTTAPSTVWDELDDLKSRIHRLELTGKLPSTSGAAVSRLSDDRPATATTTVTSMSLSPKRQGAGPVTEAASNTSSQKEAYPVLHAALLKTKPFLSPGLYQALEAAANDALELSSMMGMPGQPGPISSAASTIGPGGLVTDRQLRRKADSVCRSLTELCVALGDGVAQPKFEGPITSPVMTQNDGSSTPTIPKSYSGLPTPRRSSIAEHGTPKSTSSPRSMSKFEERRSSILNGSALPTPRSAGSTSGATMEGNVQRRSSLMVARTRRAGTEEPDLGRTPSVLRARRAGTDEPEEGRRTSFLLRNRRGTLGEDGDEGRFQATSRAGTGLNTIRSHGKEYPLESQQTPPDSISQGSSALPRRRFLSSNLHSSRLAGPSGPSPVSPRQHVDRPTTEQETEDYS